ncbi:MAG: PEP-CTERM sorting domain-containing protein, partial [Parasphingopyxis sp.]
MALAKLCACAAGGAVVGGGAVHVAEAPAGGPVETRTAEVRTAAARTAARPAQLRRIKGVRRVRTTTTTTSCASTPTVVSVTNQVAAPQPAVYHAPAPVPIYGEVPSFGGGGSGGVIGGGGFVG